MPYGPLWEPKTVEEEQFQQLQYNREIFETNSPLYNSVIISLRALIERFNWPIFSAVDNLIQRHKNIEIALEEILVLYEHLLTSCSLYLSRRREAVQSASNQEARFKLIENIFFNAQQECQILQYKYNWILNYPLYLLNNTLTYKDILSDIRAEVIDITGREDISFTGANASKVLIIGMGEQQRFFKWEDFLFDPGGEPRDPQEIGVSVHEKARRKKKQQFCVGTICAEIAEGSEISGRNVAMSRLAVMLGAPDLVVKAHRAIIKKQGESSQPGIIMSKAVGESIRSIAQDMLERDVAQANLKITPEAKRQFCMLQLLDLISGQVDRHPGIFLLPTLRANPLENLPYIDREFTEDILALHRLSETKEIIDFVFGDILSEDEIFALKDRLVEITRVLSLYPPNRILTRNQWDQAGISSYCNNPNLNYLSRFIYTLQQYLKSGRNGFTVE